ncbi:MAG: Unknown protein [uncultured Sulfurovum sp.]|uniref:N-acetyltransferase domain-containing protein n=1 Tax=uncultured Sulfurovum sp. TaxID=269237 RepID=A0A6S6TZZ7_9BACT|nr:MAG: Unknown protein [uncultured Sulfurovum sp.]
MDKKTYKIFIKNSIKRFAKDLEETNFYSKKDAIKLSKKIYVNNTNKDFKNSEFGFYTIYNKKKKKIGYLWLKNEKKMLLISEIYIRKKYRNQGYGNALMSKIEKIAKKLKVDKIELSVMVKKNIAKILYIKYGFSVISELMMKKV